MRISYGSLVIAIEGAEAPLAWLREFLGGAFGAPSPSAPPDHTLRLEFGAAQEDVGGASEDVEVFSLDGSFVRLPARRAPDGSLAIRDDAEGIRYVLRGRDVTVLAAADGPAPRLALLRVARELATARALSQGFLHLHAAAVEVAGSVVAMAGPRGSGKTTLLLHALLDGKARYVANDRLFADLRPDPPLARGMPTIVRLREETLARFPSFARRLEASAYARHRTLAEAAVATGFRPNLTPAQLRALADAGETAEGPLRAALFPSVASGVGRFEIRALPAEEAAARVRKGLFLATLPERPAAAFAGGTPPRDAATLARLCGDLAARVACFDVRLGPGAYDRPSVWEAIRERLP